MSTFHFCQLFPRSSTGMERAMYLKEVIHIEFCVDLRRRDTRVAEQLLDGTQVRAPLEEVRRERMPQCMRRDLRR